MSNIHTNADSALEKFETAPVRPLSTESSFCSALNNILNEKILEHRANRFQPLFDAIEADSHSLVSVVDKLFSRLHSTTKEKFKAAALEITAHIDSGDDRSIQNAYHNPGHFGKVAANFYILSQLHNSQTHTRKLTDGDIARGLLAAFAHDIAHDGTGNTVNGIHQAFRLEQIAINTTEKWLQEKIEIDGDIKSSMNLIYATDVSGTPSPAHIVRMWHDHYFNGAEEPNIIVPEPLKPVVGSAQDTLIAALLQDADVLVSVVVDKQHRLETERVAQEFKAKMTPQGSLFFLKNILQERMTTTAARELSDKFIAKKIIEYTQQLTL